MMDNSPVCSYTELFIDIIRSFYLLGRINFLLFTVNLAALLIFKCSSTTYTLWITCFRLTHMLLLNHPSAHIFICWRQVCLFPGDHWLLLPFGLRETWCIKLAELYYILLVYTPNFKGYINYILSRNILTFWMNILHLFHGHGSVLVNILISTV